MDRKIDGKYTADFLWEEKGVLPFLKVDKGLERIGRWGSNNETNARIG